MANVRSLLFFSVVLILSLVTTSPAQAPAVERPTAVPAVAAGEQHTCVLIHNGTARCWGRNDQGQLGDGTTADSPIPVAVQGLTSAVAIAAGGWHTCALIHNGTARCWGRNGAGQLGNGESGEGTFSSAPVRVQGLAAATAITTGGNHTCALLRERTVRCWGWNRYGQLGHGPPDESAHSPVPVAVQGLTAVKAITAGGGHTCALIHDGAAQCWGANGSGLLPSSSGQVPNGSGQLGDGTRTDSPVPVAVRGLPAATAIAAGGFYTCALLSDGTVRCWGRNKHGQLGDGTMTDSLAPIVVQGLTAATAIAAGTWHSCALMRDGAVRCWGNNAYGKLGNGTMAASLAPTEAKDLSTATAIAAGGGHSCALLREGTVWCWGSSDNGQLGDGTKTGSPAPVMVQRLATIVTAQVPKPAQPPRLTASVRFTDQDGNGVLDADEAAEIAVEVQNGGKGEAYRVAVRLSATTPIPGLHLPQAAASLGVITLGQNARAAFTVAGGEGLATGKAALTVLISEANGFDADPVTLAFQTRAVVPPALTISRIELADTEGKETYGNGNGMIERGETVEAKVWVQNGGPGPAQGVTAKAEVHDPNIFLLSQPETVLGLIPPGGTLQIPLLFTVNKRYAGKNALPIALTLTERRPRFSTTLPLLLALDEAAPRFNVVEIAPKDAQASPAPPPESPVESVDQPPKGLKGVARPDAYAVVIGIEKYRDLAARAEYATRDAETVKRYLTDLMGIPEKNIKVLLNERATGKDLEKTIETWLPNQVKTTGRVFIYYSGHGAPEPTSGATYLVPYDGDPAYLPDTGYATTRLYDALAKLPTKEVIVVLDTCFSGAGGRSVIAKRNRPMAVANEGKVPTNVTVLAAAGAAQISTAYEEAKHGLFTYFLLKGLSGAADANRDGTIEIGELYPYLKDKVETEARRNNVDQTPQLIPDLTALGPGASFPLAVLAK